MWFKLFTLTITQTRHFCGSSAKSFKSRYKFRYSAHPLYCQCATAYAFFQRARTYTKFISFTLDYGMRCGFIVRMQLSGIAEFAMNGLTP